MSEKPPIDWQIQSGPCSMCGAVNYPLSFGGPSVCPACDSGAQSPYVLQKHIATLKSEVERLKVERDAAQSALAVVEHERNSLERELKEAQAAAAVMRLVLEDIATDNLDRVSGGVKQSAQESISTTAGTAFLARMAEAEWLVDHADACDFVEFDEQEAWLKRQHAFLKGDGVKA